MPADFTGALAVVSKCLTHIASAKRSQEADDYIIDFDRAGTYFMLTCVSQSSTHSFTVNLPKPSAIIARLFVCL